MCTINPITFSHDMKLTVVTEVLGDMDPLEPGVKPRDPLLPPDPPDGGEEMAEGPSMPEEGCDDDLRCV